MPRPEQTPASPLLRGLISAALIALAFWLIPQFGGGFATIPTLRDAPPKGGLEVAIHLKDGSAIFENVRVEDFADGTAERTVMLSEPPAKPGEPSRGAFLSLRAFKGKTGRASLEVLPFGWTGAPLKLEIAEYEQCDAAGPFGPIADINICSRQVLRR